MHELYELKEKLLKELMSYSQNGKFSKEDAEVMKYLSSTIDHICNIVMGMEEEGGSNRGSYYEDGSYERRGGGRSMRRGSYREGSYRDGGSSMRRGSYYRDGAKEELIEKIEEMMEQTQDENKRQTLQRMIKQIEQS